jgi:hypothetical protein
MAREVALAKEHRFPVIHGQPRRKSGEAAGRKGRALKMEKEERVILRTYPTAWKYEKKIYAIDRMRLLVPVNPSQVFYFLIGLLITMGILKIFPFLNAIPFIFRYALIPFALMKFLTKKKFDGKLPHKFALGYIEYLLLPRSIARFQAGEQYKKGKFESIAFRRREVSGIMAPSMKKGGKKRVQLSGKIF